MEINKQKIKKPFPVTFALVCTGIAFYIFALFFLQAISPLGFPIDWQFFFAPFLRFDLVIVGLPFLAIPLFIVFIFFYGLGNLIQKMRTKEKL